MVPFEDFLLRSIDTRPFLCVSLGVVLHKMDCVVGTFNLQKCSLWCFPWHHILPILFLMIFFVQKSKARFSFFLVFSFQHCVVVRSQSDGCFPSEGKQLQEACKKITNRRTCQLSNKPDHFKPHLVHHSFKILFLDTYQQWSNIYLSKNRTEQPYPYFLFFSYC